MWNKHTDNFWYDNGILPSVVEGAMNKHYPNDIFMLETDRRWGHNYSISDWDAGILFIWHNPAPQVGDILHIQGTCAVIQCTIVDVTRAGNNVDDMYKIKVFKPWELTSRPSRTKRLKLVLQTLTQKLKGLGNKVPAS